MITYFRRMLKNVRSFEGSSALSVTVVVGGGVEMDGTETVELVAEGAGDARSMVEPEEAYAMFDRLQDSRLSRKRRRRRQRCREAAMKRLSRGCSPNRAVSFSLKRVEPSLAGGDFR